ncbi:histidine phosphatase superfamily [Cladochytrium replicatum]|nr:histidine phosphatase superfamily [Cladochytrium replicatum]
MDVQSSQKRLILCRHGETAFNAAGILQGSGVNGSLSELGRWQAGRLRDYLKKNNENVGLIVTSALNRARETGEIVAEAYPDAAFVVIPELAEIGWGEWEGKKDVPISTLVHAWMSGDLNARGPGGESPLEVEKRAIPKFYELLKSRLESTIVFCLHGRLLRILLASILFNSLEDMQGFQHHNCCINILTAHIRRDSPWPSESRKQLQDDPVRLLLDKDAAEGFKTKAIDDNVTVSNHGSLDALASDSDETDRVVTGVTHDTRILFTPEVLNLTSHLSRE